MEAYQQLEQRLGEWCGNPNTVVCSSGTAALHLALEALALPLGSQVIVPEFTMIACARAVTLAGLEPVFIDCGDDLLLNPSLLQEVMTDKTKAIMPVHIYGRRCAMDIVASFAQEHGLAVVEDLAEAHGVLPHPSSDAACWSFYRNKIVAGEEGGAIAFKDSYHAARAKELRSLGFSQAHDFLHRPRGINARLSNTHAELILHSLNQVEENLDRRAQVEEWYNQRIQQKWRMPSRHVCWVYDIRLPGHNCESVVHSLNSRGISARLAFKPMSQQPEYRGRYTHLAAYQHGCEVIYLPVFPEMTMRHVNDCVTHLLGSIPILL